MNFDELFLSGESFKTRKYGGRCVEIWDNLISGPQFSFLVIVADLLDDNLVVTFNIGLN